jgi:hypothetical protein
MLRMSLTVLPASGVKILSLDLRLENLIHRGNAGKCLVCVPRLGRYRNSTFLNPAQGNAANVELLFLNN